MRTQPARYNYSLTLKEEGNLDQSKNILYKILDKNPDYTSAKNNLGLIYIQEKEYSKALQLFFQILKVDSMSIQAYQNISKTYNLAKQYDFEWAPQCCCEAGICRRFPTVFVLLLFVE